MSGGVSSGKYSPKTLNMKQRSLSGDDENAESLMNSGKENEMTISKIRSPKDLWKWFVKDPCKRWHVMFFVGFFILSFILIIVSAVDTDSSYVLSGIAGLIVSLYGFYYFRTLIALKEQVDQFERNNNSFKHENAQLTIELNKLRNTKEELSSAANSLRDATKRSQQNLEKFEKMSKNMELLGEQNVDGMSRLASLTKTIAQKWRDELLEQERQLYMDVFEQLEMKDNSEDMTLNEYNDFLDTLPPKYRMRLQHQNSFQTLAGDDNKVNYKEFGDLLDKMARDFAKSPRAPASSSNDTAGAGDSRNGVSSGVVEE